MGTAKIISMSVGPQTASNLCFPVDGILEGLNSELQLGAPITFQALKPTPPIKPAHIDPVVKLFLSRPTNADKSRLTYDAPTIQQLIEPSTLAWLRAAPLEAALLKAINSRQNAYYAKYANQTQIIAEMTGLYSDDAQLNPSPNNASRLNPTGWTTSKPQYLANLQQLSLKQATALYDAYNQTNRKGVVISTHSQVTAQSDSETAMEMAPGYDEDKITLDSLPSGGEPMAGWYVETGGEGETQLQLQEATSGSAITTTNYAYRVPIIESGAQGAREQVSLIDERFGEFMHGQSLPNLTTVFDNELQSIDLDVIRLQLAYLNTILTSPVSGTVTGIYKQPGDAVRAGEPVVRVEDDSVVLIVAKLLYAGLVANGTPVTISTNLFDATPTTVTGTVVAVRGRNEQWDVVIQCANIGPSGALLPVNYQFDYDPETTATIA